MNNVVDGLIIRVDRAEERFSELEDMSGETSKTQKKKNSETKNRISKNWLTTTKCVYVLMGTSEGKERGRKISNI